MAENRGSIAFFSTYRPPVPLDIYSTPVPPKSKHDELRMTDGLSSNYNGQMIPRAALSTTLNTGKILGSQANKGDVDSAMIFVSEREHSLETLHIALRFKNSGVQIFNFADVYGTFSDVRMEDSGSITGDYLVYISTMEDPNDRRQPWTVVYKTNLKTGETDRLTPSWQADLNPVVSPSGDKIAVASFQLKGGWHGEIEDLQTDIYVMNLVKPFKRKLVVENGGWPTWGSDNVIFFHRKVEEIWGVFRADINSGEIIRVTPDSINAMTPAAISGTKVAVATVREKSVSMDVEREEEHYRHIEIFDLNALQHPTKITQKTRPKADHFNPFVIDGGNRIGYHRCNCDLLTVDEDDTPRKFHKLKSPHSDVGLFRVSGVFPAFSSDGSKLVFVDNELRTLWLVEREREPRIIYDEPDDNVMFSPVWNPKEDILYICKGPAFSADTPVDICAIFKVSEVEDEQATLSTLTDQSLLSNNAFPSSSPDGKRLVFRSTRSGGEKRYKNLFIMDAINGEYNEGRGKTERLTEGNWTDTHCQWSPAEATSDWIVFSSTRNKPEGAPDKDNGLDPGYFAVYLVNVKNKSVVVRVIGSGYDLAGHVNHPFFSPDGKSITVTSDLAAVSSDPISLPFFLHSVRPYGDIFLVDIDSNDIEKNNDVKKFTRITHSRYENSTPSWTMMPIHNLDETWNLHLEESKPPSCPFADSHGAETWRMTGHLCISSKKRCC